jgi:hypothetical protein
MKKMRFFWPNEANLDGACGERLAAEHEEGENEQPVSFDLGFRMK